jgi:hypothetical protein
LYNFYRESPRKYAGWCVGDFIAGGQAAAEDATDDGARAVVRGCSMTSYQKRPHHQHFMHVLEADPSILEYLAHPRMVAMAEEVRRPRSDARLRAPKRTRQTPRAACSHSEVRIFRALVPD